MQQIQLSIPEPCHEDWQHMNPTEQGRFCNACAKQVVDFSTMSDREVLNYFSTINNEKVCGRAYPDQLERAITIPKDPKKRLFWHWNYITMLFLFFSKTNVAKAQIGKIAISSSKLDSVKKAEIDKALLGRVGGVGINTNQIISGTIKDKDGNPIPFATIKIEGKLAAINADAQGKYSIKTNIKNDVLEVNAAGYISGKFVLSSLNTFDFILEQSQHFWMGEIVISSNPDFIGEDKRSTHIAVLEILDNKTHVPVSNASIIIGKAGKNNKDSVLTDKKGIYKLKNIKQYETYSIKVIAKGYQSSEFTINGNEIQDRKVAKEVMLNKIETVSIATSKKPGLIIMGGISSSSIATEPLYIIDDIQFPKGLPVTFDPADIENISALKGIEAAAIFGPKGAAGAIIIKTKKKENLPLYKKMDSVKIISYGTQKHGCRMGGVSSISTVTEQRNNFLKDTLISVTTKITGALKISPNPVQKGNVIKLTLKLKEMGVYNIQITDAAGRIVVQKQSNATTKQYIEELPTNSSWGSGIYYVSIYSSNQKMISTSNFIIQ